VCESVTIIEPIMQEPESARIYGVPGERARAAGVMRAVGPLLAALFVLGLFSGLLLPRITWEAAGLGLLVTAAALVWAVRDGLAGLDAFFKGARGEERVAWVLSGLPRGFHVFHDLLCGGRSEGIDHVVVGPTGLFAIETKCWSGSVTLEEGVLRVDGGLPSRPPLEQARASAAAVTSFLAERVGGSPACVPVVCFASNTFRPGVSVCEGCVVCNVSGLAGVMRERGGHLSADEIERAVKVLEQKDV
jgi:hypothetical protein